MNNYKRLEAFVNPQTNNSEQYCRNVRSAIRDLIASSELSGRSNLVLQGLLYSIRRTDIPAVYAEKLQFGLSAIETLTNDERLF